MLFLLRRDFLEEEWRERVDRWRLLEEKLVNEAFLLLLLFLLEMLLYTIYLLSRNEFDFFLFALPFR